MKSSFIFWIICLNLFYPVINAITFELLPATKIILFEIEFTIFSFVFIMVIIFLASCVSLREIVTSFLKKKVNKLISLIIFCYLLFFFLQVFNFRSNDSILNIFGLGYKYYVYFFFSLSSLILSIKFGNLFFISLNNSKKFFFFLIFILTLVYLFLRDNRGLDIERFHLERLDPNSIVVFSGIISLYLISRFFYLINTKSYYQIILNSFFLILSYYVIYQTNSVGIVINLLFISIILIILILRSSILKIFFLLIYFFTLYLNSENFLSRLNILVFDESSSLHERVSFYSYALSSDNLLNSFLIGSNIDFLNIFSFHNLVLELYYSGGFFLLVLFTFIFLKTLISYFKIIKSNNLIMDKFLLSILLFNILNSFIGGIFSIDTKIWSLLGIVIARLYMFRNKSFIDSSKVRM